MSEKVAPVLVDVRWLQSHPEVRIVDIRWNKTDAPGRENYRAGHIPGAVYADLDTELSRVDKSVGGRHPLPDTQDFAAFLGRVGIGRDTHVVAYDDVNLSFAGRLWFMLRAHGLPNVSLLDGGLAAWTEAGLPLEKGEVGVTPVPPPALKLDSSQIVTRAEVEQLAAGKSDLLLFDARAAERYRGEVEPLDRIPGHIPGAVNAPWSANLDAKGRFRPPAELRAMYEKLIGGRRNVASSCGSGVTGCHDLIAMAAAGLPVPRLYVGSYSEWSQDPSRPIATGANPR